VCSHAQRHRPPSPFNFVADTIKATYISFVGDTSTSSVWGKLYDKALDSQYHFG
jgi:hypothetical protein